jgi:hypothetical protein
MVIWWKIVPGDLGLDFAETFHATFSIVLHYLDADQGFRSHPKAAIAPV